MGSGISITTVGVDALAKVLKGIAKIPETVQRDMVDAMADVVKDAQVYTAGTMLQGPYYKGDVAASITKSKVKKRKSGPYVDIEFKGESHGNRNAEIAFINEYGKKKQLARPFIKTANTLSDEPSRKAGFDVYDNWLKSKGV
jgi:hypothetical protein